MSIKRSVGGAKSPYDHAFKSAVCFEILSGNLSYTEARRKYGIQGHTTIHYWVRKYEKQFNGVNLHSMKDTDAPAHSSNPEEEGEDLQKKNHELEAALKMAKLKITALETMIDIAESDLNIDIRKKSGTKQ